MKKHLICQSSQLRMIITVFVHIKRFHIYRRNSIFVFTFTVKRFHIYGTLLHLALKVFTFTGPYYIFTFRGATLIPLRTPIVYIALYREIQSFGATVKFDLRFCV